MKKFLLGLLLFAAFAFGTVVAPSQSSLAILLDASGLCKNASFDSWEKLRLGDFLKDNAFYGDPNSIYCHSYDGSMSPSEAADSLFKGENSVFVKAIEKWKQNGGRSNFENVPNRFVIIAEGAAGLAVREYVQGKDYQGEIENVVFFNTPHEGTGFADQALLNGSSVLNKNKSVSDYSDIVPLALAVYLVGGDVLEDLMMSLLKEAVFGMVQNAGDIKKRFSGYFDNADKSYKSLLYLAQDLDPNDEAYDGVKKKIREKSLELENFAGSVQLLNSYSKLNAFEHPAYGNVYSYGLPSIGNGRRTLADFADQSKNHISKDKLQRMLAESVSSALEENGKDFVPEEVQSIVAGAMGGDFASDAVRAANQIASRYDIPWGKFRLV